jgi:hypothetical protein
MTRRRTLIAFAVAPAPLPMFVFVRTLDGPWGWSDAALFAGIYAAFTYGAALLGGVPVHLTFQRKGWNAWWQYTLAGAAIGVAVFLALLMGFENWEKVGRLPRQILAASLWFVIPGAVSAILFWIIAIRRRGAA